MLTGRPLEYRLLNFGNGHFKGKIVITVEHNNKT